MTAAVNQASYVAATPVGMRGARHADSSETGFGEALGATTGRSRHPQTDGHTKARAGAHNHEKNADAAAEDIALASLHDDGALVEETGGESDRVVPDGDAEAIADAQIANTDPDAGLPTQMKAEQAISAMMAMGRHAAAPGDNNPETPADNSGHATALDVRSEANPRAGGSQNAAAAEAAMKPAGPELPATDMDVSAATLAHVRKGERKAAGQDDGKAATTLSDDANRSSRTDAAASPKTAVEGGNGPAASDSSGSHDGAPESRRNEPQPVAAKVSVIAQQAAPAPVAPQLSANATAVVSAIAGEQGWRPSGTAAEPPQALRSYQPMRSLKIELHPAELGTVTANLKAVGEHISVELQVDNQEAYHRLSADSDAIVKSLRALGYEIDSVSIQQPQAASTAVARADAGTGSGSLQRDTSSFQSGNSGNGSERSGGQTSGQGGRSDGQRNDPARELRQDRAGGSLYI